jgi:hypothetical protein
VGRTKLEVGSMKHEVGSMKHEVGSMKHEVGRTKHEVGSSSGFLVPGWIWSRSIVLPWVSELQIIGELATT